MEERLYGQVFLFLLSTFVWHTMACTTYLLVTLHPPVQALGEAEVGGGWGTMYMKGATAAFPPISS